MTVGVPQSRRVVLDTDVFSLLYVRTKVDIDDRLRAWRADLAGATVVIATQTRAEILFGAALVGWGAARMQRVNRLLDATPTAPVTEEVVQAYIELRVACQRAGHALAAKIHGGDLWIAATAIAIDAALLSVDRIYDDAPGLTVM